MASLHPHWQSTEDEQPVAVRARTTAAKPARLSRAFAAVVSMVMIAGIAVIAFDGWPSMLGQITNPEPDVTIRITQDGFDPSTVEVQPGQTVRWINDDLIPHILSSEKLPTNDGQPFASPGLFSGNDFFYTVPDNASGGSYLYISQTATHVDGTLVILAAESVTNSSTPTLALTSAPSSAAITPALVRSSASSSTSKTETLTAIAVNPHVVGAGAPRQTAQPTVTQHRPVMNAESGPAIWIALSMSAGGILYTTRWAFKRV